jgi:uncharacterized protein YgbK (DUF1537 family)
MSSPPLLGCIADDMTGASDLAGTLVREGMRVVQLVGVPTEPIESLPPADAVVIALKSRNAPPREAVGESIDSVRWLAASGCRTTYFKYCSTFDSTPQGNIGPVADALLAELGARFAVIAPAFPRNARTVFAGHLFVGDVLLSDSSMRHHPLTPMTDSDVVALMAAQSSRRVGLVHYRDVNAGASAIRERIDALAAEGFRYAVVDALRDDHLLELARAVVDDDLVTGGSALAGGLATVMRERGSFDASSGRSVAAPEPGFAAVLAGSCSAATTAQVERTKRAHPAYELDPAELARGRDVVGEAVAWAAERLADGPVLIYSTTTADGLERARRALGPDSSERVEQIMRGVAQALKAAGVTRLVVAGGETSGAVVDALGVTSMAVGEELAPGVPVLATTPSPGLALVLKSGNFGAPDFFEIALNRLAELR